MISKVNKNIRESIIRLFTESIDYVQLYHVSSVKFKKFDLKFTPQGIIWFSKVKPDNPYNVDGAAISRYKPVYLYTCSVKAKQVAGWDLYNDKSLYELVSLGYDFVDLDDVCFSLDVKNITIKSIEDVTKKDNVNESQKVRIFRALPSGETVIRTGDYVTMSAKFAIEHAENNHIYEDAPHDVVMAITDRNGIKDASNPGEYLATKDVEGEPIYTSKGYDYEGWDSVKNDLNVRRHTRPFVEGDDDQIPSEFPLAGDQVDNLEVLDDVPNMGSISATLDDYKILQGIREVPISGFETDIRKNFYSKSDHDRVRHLSNQIKDSHQIKPLIVVKDREGLYVLEGGHRLVALAMIGVKTIPALVVLDLEV